MAPVKLLGGFIAGFFLAIFIFSLAIFLYTAPQLESIEEALDLTELIYNSTHSPEFDSGLALVDMLGTGAEIPFIGEYIGDIGNLKELLLAVKDLSETAKQTLELAIFITNVSLYISIVSLIAFIIGTFIAFKPEKRVLKD